MGTVGNTNMEAQWLYFHDVMSNPVLYYRSVSQTLFTFSSFTSMFPDPSVSNRSNASLISCLCSSVSSGLGPALFRWFVVALGFLKLEALKIKAEREIQPCFHQGVLSWEFSMHWRSYAGTPPSFPWCTHRKGKINKCINE